MSREDRAAFSMDAVTWARWYIDIAHWYLDQMQSGDEPRRYHVLQALEAYTSAQRFLASAQRFLAAETADDTSSRKELFRLEARLRALEEPSASGSPPDGAVSGAGPHALRRPGS